MVHPSKQQTLDFIRQNSPIKTKKAFSDVYKYIHQCTYHDDTNDNDINDLMISFLTNTVKDMYITTKQINSLRRYGYYHRKDFIKLPWLKYNVMKGYIPEQSQIECFTEFFDFDTVVELLKRHKDINPHIYFKNYNVLDKLFRNNNELFKIDTTNVQELEKLKAQIDFVDRFFTDAGIDPCLLLSTKENKINIPYHIEKKNYNLEVVYTNYLLYRKFKKLPVNLIELINLSYMLIPRINDEYILYNTYNKQQLINQINSMNDGHMKMKLLELLTRNTINSKYYYDAVNKNYVLEKPITSDDSDIDLDEDELEHDIAHLNLTDEQRQEMGLPVKKKPSIVDNTQGTKIFDLVYNDKCDEDLLIIISGLFTTDTFQTELQIKMFNYLVEKGCPLTEKIFKVYCKQSNSNIVELFLENKFKPTDDIFLQVNFDNTTHILCFYQLLNKYNYYISAENLSILWNKLRSKNINSKTIQSFSIYVNNDEEFNKILPELEEKYNKYIELKTLFTYTYFSFNKE